MNAWPDDILCIRYTELADTAENRINLLNIISRLLNRSPNSSFTQEDLGLDQEGWNLLCIWIKQGNGFYFWQVEPQGIQSLHKCEKHIILDTTQLLADLANVFSKSESPQRITLDDIWLTARHIIESRY